jgi:hypothetical protein
MFGIDHVNQLARIRITRNHGYDSFQVRIGAFGCVQAAVGLAGGLVRSMAIETFAGQNGKNVPGVVYGFPFGGNESEEAQEG